MKAYVLEGIGSLTYKEAPTPHLGEDEALVQVMDAGICGSDIPRVFKTGTYHFPTIPGHEFAGIVRQVGAERNAGLLNKRVGVFPLMPCMECEACRRKAYEMCSSYNYLGSRTDGGFAEYVAVPVWNLIELPDSVSFEDAAMLEPTAVALHAARQILGRDGQTFAEINTPAINITSAAVYGCGTIGALALQWLSAMGVGRIYAVGTRKEQRELIGRFSDAVFCNCREEDPVRFIMDRTEERGTDAVFECVGTGESIRNSVSTAAAGGQIVLVGNPAGDIGLDKQVYWRILRKQLKFHGTWNSSFTKEETDDWHTAVRAIASGKISPSGQITHRIAFGRLPEGLEIMRDKDIFSNKVMIKINSALKS